MTPTNGDDPDGATGATEAGRVVELDGVNTRSTATNPAKLQELILALAELLPAVFVADRWELYRPLKRGIHRDLIDRGVLLPDECRAVLRRYCSRLMYQRAVAACGPRFDLDRHAAGDVAPDEADHAKAAVAKIEAKQEHKAKVAKVIADNERATRKAAVATAPARTPKEMPAAPPPSAKQVSLGLAELKEAARARQEVADD